LTALAIVLAAVLFPDYRFVRVGGLRADRIYDLFLEWTCIVLLGAVAIYLLNGKKKE